MDIKTRQSSLIRQINAIKDEETLEMLEESLVYFTHNNSKDITDGLTPYQLKELTSLADEPSDKDIVSLDEYKKNTSQWRTKS